jgi:plastocyanin
MRRSATVAAVGAVAVALASGVADAGHSARRHRIFLPAPELPSSVAVDEAEYTLRPSQTVVAAGPVTVRAYNRGQDDHNIFFYDAKGDSHTALLNPGKSATLTADFKPGTYTFVCSLFAGTPESHEALGMHFVLTVK